MLVSTWLQLDSSWDHVGIRSGPSAVSKPTQDIPQSTHNTHDTHPARGRRVREQGPGTPRFFLLFTKSTTRLLARTCANCYLEVKTRTVVKLFKKVPKPLQSTHFIERTTWSPTGTWAKCFQHALGGKTCALRKYCLCIHVYIYIHI